MPLQRAQPLTCRRAGPILGLDRFLEWMDRLGTREKPMILFRLMPYRAWVTLPVLVVALALGAGCEKNRPPVLNAIGNQAVTAGETLEFTVTATDPDGATPGLSATNLPGNASFVDHADGTGTFTWDTLAEDAGTYAGVVFTASDGKLSDTETITISVNEAEGEGEGEGEGVAEGEGLAEGEGAVEGEGLAEGEGEGVIEGEGEEPWEP